jgi:hypothetical protein
MVVGGTDVEMKDASPAKNEKTNGVVEEEPPKDPELLTLEGINRRLLTGLKLPILSNIVSPVFMFIEHKFCVSSHLSSLPHPPLNRTCI